jgi:hypothetical protein
MSNNTPGTARIADEQAVSSSLALVRRYMAECHPDAEVALLAGSRSRGEGAGLLLPGSINSDFHRASVE